MSGREQNGRLSCPSTTDNGVFRRADPRIRNTTTMPSVDQHGGTCRDFVWGICNKGAQCKYRHELSFEAMKNILKFCHDFQNKSGCTRPGCTYLHTTNDEENLFLTTGHIPRILQERYAAMSANNNVPYLKPPPPPPPSLPVVSAPPLPSSALLPTLLAPPPPPPPLPPTISSTAVQSTPAAYTAPSVSALTLKQTNQQTLQLSGFDASKPPPPLPIETSQKLAFKRPLGCPLDTAPPPKVRKEDVPIVDSPCETCIHRELRYNIYQKEAQRLEVEKDCQTYMYQKKLESFENGKLLLKAAVSPELYRILSEYIESPTPQILETITPSLHFPVPSIVGSSSLQNNFLRNILDSSRNVVDPGPRTMFGNGADIESLLKVFLNAYQKPDRLGPAENAFSSLGERSSAIGASSTSEVPLRSFLTAGTSSSAPFGADEKFKQAQQPKRAHSQNVIQSFSPIMMFSNTEKGINLATQSTHQQAAAHVPQAHQYAHVENVQSELQTTSLTPSHNTMASHQVNPRGRSMTVPQMSTTQPAAALQMQHVQQPRPHNAAHPPNVTPAAVPPTAYLPYHAAVPPPHRQYYNQHPSTSNAANMAYPHARPGVCPQPTRASSQTAQQSNYSYNVPRYPPHQQHYYPAYSAYQEQR